MKRFLFLICLILYCSLAFSQGRTHHWLLGHLTNKGRALTTDSSFSHFSESRSLPVRTTQGNIADEQGNLLMSSNGVWIADGSGQLMQNGNGLNPGQATIDWDDGLPLPNGNLFLPWPEDSNKYALFHHSFVQDGMLNSAHELFLTTIDMTLNNGLGGVTNKNQIIVQDTLGWGITACRHANGRDWWVIMLKDNSTFIRRFLFTPYGITIYPSQNLSITPGVGGNVTQLTFSPNGQKFAYTNTYRYNFDWNFNLRLYDFDRCSGLFSSGMNIHITDSLGGVGLAFSSDSKYLYSSSMESIYQVKLDTVNIAASLTLVARNDTFYSPNPPWRTNFEHMYLGANGKIYITSANSVQHLHSINSPDSGGLACDVQLHNINLGIKHFRGVPNHPNYYLGAIAGSLCDSLGVGIQQFEAHDFRFSVSPNPSNGNFRMIYLLPQNQSGMLEVYDVNGRRVYAMNLPPWSTMQEVALPSELAGGVYSCVVSSGGQRAARKLVLIR